MLIFVLLIDVFLALSGPFKAAPAQKHKMVNAGVDLGVRGLRRLFKQVETVILGLGRPAASSITSATLTSTGIWRPTSNNCRDLDGNAVAAYCFKVE